MTERDFCYWLQGAFEIGVGAEGLTQAQVQVIKNHLNLVFVHSIDTPDPTGQLQAAHDGKKILTEEDRKEMEKKLQDLQKQVDANKYKHAVARC